MRNLLSTTISLFLLSAVCSLNAQSVRVDSLSVYFSKDDARIDTLLLGNYKAIEKIVDIVSRYSLSESFEISLTGYASPEGSSAFNAGISTARAESLIKFIQERTGAVLDSASVRVCGAGVDWAGFEKMLIGSEPFPYRDRVLSVVRDVPLWVKRNGRIVGGRKKTLMDINGGRVFNYMMDNMFPDLRRVDVVLRYRPFEAVERVPVVEDELPEPERAPLPPRILPEPEPLYRMALKTNLLADIALMPSLEAEFLINRSWSVAAHGAVAWWSKDSEHRYYQIATIYPEARWWFSAREPWKGHYLGVFAGGTWYDLENGGRGYKGEGGFVGLSYGYMFPIGKRLSLEAGIGAGWLYTEYEEYLPVPYMDGTHYVYQQTSRLNWLGPLKVKFALVWRLWDVNNRKGGGR